jgi:glycosyltransferase involved in cell wall biosynthesis
VGLNVGLNLLHLVPEETGGSELYARRLIAAIVAAEPTLHVTAFASRLAVPSLAAEGWGDRVEVVGLPFDARSRARRVLAEQTLLARELGRRRLDLLHNLFTTAPAAPGVPQVSTILDVIYKRFPDAHPGILSRGLAALVWLSARRSERVITISEAAKADIVRFLDLPADRVDVTYLGPGLEADGRTSSESDVRTELDLGDAPIVLTVSAKRPHKNLVRLLEAFSRVRFDPLPVLVVPGYATWHEETLHARATAAGVAERVRFTGWLANDVLDGLYRAAACLVFPSLAEGFGLPILDALVRGTPVACSNASSLPEVAGEAALYFDPTDVDAIRASIERLLGDDELGNRLVAAGRKQAQKFSWARTAEGTFTSYERALATARS